jgi:hypothetical protein
LVEYEKNPLIEIKQFILDFYQELKEKKWDNFLDKKKNEFQKKKKWKKIMIFYFF